MFLPFFVAAALATPSYPGDLESTLSMPCTPTCTVCHATNSGGSGTVTEAFGIAMMDSGLTGGGMTANLQAALDMMAMHSVDSDGDGVIDVDELAAGGDPNSVDVELCAGPPVVLPEYGCLNTVSGAKPSAAGLFGALLAIAAMRRRAAPGG